MRGALILLVLASSLLAPAAQAENLALPPPRSPAGQALAADFSTRGIASDLTYAASAENIAKPKPPPPVQPPLIPGGAVSVWWVLGGLAAALLLWLRFGGSGILTRRAPEEGGPVRAPDHWQVETLAPATLLGQIAAMEDRSAALVRLLRHCLLKAAEDSRTRLARSDTERQAFARLPGDRPALRLILQLAELAHYGGRPVDDQGFAEALEAGRGLLGGAHG